MQSSSGRRPGNPYKREFLLTDEQRLSFGTDRWFTVTEIAATLGISQQTVRAAIQRGALKAFKVPRSRGKPLAATLGIGGQVIRSAIQQGELKAFKVARGNRKPIVCVKGWRVIIWRDQLAGLSDGREEDHESSAGLGDSREEDEDPVAGPSDSREEDEDPVE